MDAAKEEPARGETGGACNCAACMAAASQLAKHAKQKAETAIGDLDALVRQNPRSALAGALGVGLVLGLLLRRH